MRRRRAILFDDDLIVLNMLEMFFAMRGYEVIACREPVRCPVYGDDGACENLRPCGDLMLADYQMPKKTGVALLQEQERMGCRLTNKNKAIISGCLDPAALQAIRELGCTFFQKPFVFDELDRWIYGCEQRMDLSQPLGFKRKEPRHACCSDAALRIGRDDVSRTAEIVNKSESGVCIRIDMPLAKDQVVDLQLSVPPASSRFLVRWSIPVRDNGYLAGMSCC